MAVHVQINDLLIKAESFAEETVIVDEMEKRKLSFSFKVKSHESHQVTTTLYKNDFLIQVKERGIEFPASILRYYTSITDLSNEDAVADFELELIEKV